MESADGRKLTLKEKIAYGMGDLGNNFMFDLGQIYLLHFYTDILGISGMVAGSVFLITKLFDAAADTAVGTYVDIRTNIGKRGKLRPFILFGTVPLAIATVLSFLAPNLSMDGKIIFAYASYMLFGLAYSFVNIPYGALAASMTQDPVDRTQLASFRQAAGKLGGLIVGAGVIPIVMWFPDHSVGYLVAVVIMSILGILCHLFCYKNTTEHVVTPKSDKPKVKVSLAKKFTVLLTNRPLMSLCLMSFLTLSAVTMRASMMIYYCQYHFGDIKLVSVVNTVGMVCALIGVAAMPFVVKKLGKKNSYMCAATVGAIADIANFALPTDFNTFLVLSSISWFATGFNGLCWAFISDVIEYGDWKTGERTEGIIYSVYSLIRKIAQAVAAFIPGVMFTLVGYVPNAVQSSQSLAAIKGLYLLFPATVMLLAALTFFVFYNLSDARHSEILVEINARNKAM